MRVRKQTATAVKVEISDRNRELNKQNDWQLEQGLRYRLWYRDKTPMPDIVVFERVALNLQRPQIPRLVTRPPLPIKEVWLCFRYEKSGA